MLTPDPSAVLVLDFDGTVCIGDDPVLFYAEEVAARHSEATEVVDQVREFLTGERQVAGAADGYHAVHRLSAAVGASQELLRGAYLASRSRLDAGEGQTRAPHGLADALAELRDADVRIVLATNSPRIGIEKWLAGRDLDHRMDEVISDAGKPAGMPDLLEQVATRARLQVPSALGSIGDVWANDVGPVMARGGTGFFIDRFGTGQQPSSYTGTTFEDLLPALREWAAQPR